MPTLMEHMAIAGFVALPLSSKPKWIIGLCWVAILPDLDIFLGLHRIVFHSLLILGPISAVLVGVSWHWFPNFREPALFAAFCLLSHTILDWLQGWVALLWPIVPLAFWLNIQLRIAWQGQVLLPYLEIGPMIGPLDTLFEPSEASLLNPFGFALFLLFITVALIKVRPTLKLRLQSIFQNPTAVQIVRRNQHITDTPLFLSVKIRPAAPTAPSDLVNKLYSD